MEKHSKDKVSKSETKAMVEEKINEQVSEPPVDGLMSRRV
jgi:hypothetical protein